MTNSIVKALVDEFKSVYENGLIKHGEATAVVAVASRLEKLGYSDKMVRDVLRGIEYEVLIRRSNE
jgi:hypothetical protein